MMVVISLSRCPEKLKGDLTRWLFEIDTGVYVGNLSARVRDELWDRICENIGNGRASMAYSTNSEQKLDFRIHDDRWEPVDFDGLRLVKRKFEDNSNKDYKEKSKAAVNHKLRLSWQKRSSDEGLDYTVIDVETTGITDDDRIIELGALKIREGEISESLSILIDPQMKISKEITALTGITDEMILAQGISSKEAMTRFIEFVGEDILIGHNIRFDLKYIQKQIKQAGIPALKNRTEDTMKLAKKKEFIPEGYSLASVCKHYGITEIQQHRALEDCRLTQRIYEKLKKK
ncbi:MAG: type I-E CRISPR-associated endoribonuclease Cas2 [Ruminococcus sp.]|nr:type I-E CRISPR-associated endoribonuclease Cas2 [Ruminococcus sp.]